MNKKMIIRLVKGVLIRLLLGALATFLLGTAIWAHWWYKTQLDVLYLFGEYILYSPFFLEINTYSVSILLSSLCSLS